MTAAKIGGKFPSPISLPSAKIIFDVDLRFSRMAASRIDNGRPTREN